MKICVISIGDNVTLLILGLLTTFIIEGNAKFQLKNNEKKDTIFSHLNYSEFCNEPANPRLKL